MDYIEIIGHSIIQHGKFSNRIYLMKLDKRDYPDLLPKLDNLAIKCDYGKIIAKIPATAQPVSLREGYIQEAYIPKYHQEHEGVFFMSKYLDPRRSQIASAELSKLASLLLEPDLNNENKLPENFEIKITENQHTQLMATIYQQVFKTYPFPITDASYLQKTMQEGLVIYFGIWDKGTLVGLSSAELDVSNRNAEMTDFAILPAYRGQKLASLLLKRMAGEMRIRNTNTLYTIARLNSPGMIKAFVDNGYHYSGLLKNNTNISGQIESMCVFYKNI